MRDRKLKPLSVAAVTALIAEEQPDSLVLPAPVESGLDVLVILRRTYEVRLVWNAGGFTPHERHENVVSSRVFGIDLTGRVKIPKQTIQWRDRFVSAGGALLVAPTQEVLVSFMHSKG